MIHALVFNIIFQGFAVLAGCCVVCGVWDFIFRPQTVLHKLLLRISSPFLRLTEIFTPAIIPKQIHIVLTVLSLLAARVMFFLGAGAFGLLPVVSP